MSFVSWKSIHKINPYTVLFSCKTLKHIPHELMTLQYFLFIVFDRFSCAFLLPTSSKFTWMSVIGGIHYENRRADRVHIICQSQYPISQFWEKSYRWTPKCIDLLFRPCFTFPICFMRVRRGVLMYSYCQADISMITYEERTFLI